MELALFDLDNTLLNGDSDFEWAQYLISRGIVDRALYEAKNKEFFEQYQSGTLDIDVFLDFQLRPLARHSRVELDAWHREFMDTRVQVMMSDKARTLVRQHIDSGALTAIVTATNSFVTGPIAKAFGVPHLVATIPAQVDGQFTGKPRGLPAFREGKVIRVEAWLEALGLHWSSFERSYFYSDSHNDLPLLEKVTNPVAVNPDPVLAAIAKARGWAVLSLVV